MEPPRGWGRAATHPTGGTRPNPPRRSRLRQALRRLDAWALLAFNPRLPADHRR